MRKNATRLCPRGAVQEYIREGYQIISTVDHGGEEFFVMRRERDGYRYSEPRRDSEWKAIKPTKTEEEFFDDDLFSL